MNFVVFLVCSGIGFLLGHFIPDPTWATFTSILISYHLFLAWLVFTSENEAGISLPVGHAITSHLAALCIVVGIGMGRHYIPFFGIVRYFIPAIAPFERDWIFSAEKSAKKPKKPVEPALDWSNVEPTREDEDAWLKHLATRHPLSVKRGMTVKEEYQQFVLVRAKARAAAAPAASPASTTSESTDIESKTT